MVSEWADRFCCVLMLFGRGFERGNTGCPGSYKVVHVCGMYCISSSSAADATHMHSSVVATGSRGSAQEKKNVSLVTQGFSTVSILGTLALGT